jgi:hypothetical protein
MKTNILSPIFLAVTMICCHNSLKAQMYVGGNSYVYAKNTPVFIKQDLELASASSNFYLREDAQLLQGTSSTSANKGMGSVSVYQEGTVNSFQYNYWCSPVGAPAATAGNAAFGITQLMDPATVTSSNNVAILPTSNYNGTASPLAIAPYWIWKLPPAPVNSWVYVGSGSTLNTGEGFTMKGTSGTNTNSIAGVQNNSGSNQRYDFRGKPNDGTISVPVGIGKLTLTGNPYPSAIDLSAFLTDAINSTGVAYFWEQDKTVDSHYIADYKGGYGTFSPLGGSGNGVYTPATFYSYDGSGNQVSTVGTGSSYNRRFSPIGQGFLIEGITNTTVTMKNSYRVYVKEGAANLSQFEKNVKSGTKDAKTSYFSAIPAVSGKDYTLVSAEESSHIRLSTLIDDHGVRQLVLAFLPQATDGVDHAMDALSSDQAPADVYFVLDDKEFLINALSFDEDKKIAIGFRSVNQASFKLSVKDIVNFTGANNVYLHDKITNEYFDIKNSFHEVVLPAGTNNSQFELTFKTDKTLGTETIEKSDFLVYQNNTIKSLTITNPLRKELKTFAVYDIVGKLIFNKTVLGSNTEYSFPTSQLSNGIYIVKVTTDEKTSLGQKIIVRN